MRPLFKLLSASTALLIALAAQATVIYQWVDENGRTQMSDAVPEQFKASAKRIDSVQFELSPDQKRQVQERAAKESARADEADSRRPSTPANQPPMPAYKASAPKRPAQGVTDATDCATWRRLYRESAECFGLYRTARGGMKAEAFEKCNPIPSPELKCGPPSE